jgi:hypothetical protein
MPVQLGQGKSSQVQQFWGKKLFFHEIGTLVALNPRELRFQTKK